MSLTHNNVLCSKVEKYYERLMGELERRESQFTSVVDRGESLIIAHHPASKVVEAVLATMQAKWAFLLQLTLCLETHLRHLTTSHQFFAECQVLFCLYVKYWYTSSSL